MCDFPSLCCHRTPDDCCGAIGRQVSSALQSFPRSEHRAGPARVVSVVYGGPAQLGGVRAGDVILSVNGIPSEHVLEVSLPNLLAGLEIRRNSPSGLNF